MHQHHAPASGATLDLLHGHTIVRVQRDTKLGLCRSVRIPQLSGAYPGRRKRGEFSLGRVWSAMQPAPAELGRMAVKKSQCTLTVCEVCESLCDFMCVKLLTSKR